MSHFLQNLTGTLVCAAAALPAQGISRPSWPSKLTKLGTYAPQLATTLDKIKEHVNGTKNADRTVAGAAWQLLAFDATGTNLRSGRYRDEMKVLSSWLRGQDALRGAPKPKAQNPEVPEPSRSHRTLANFAIVRTCVAANYKLLYNTVTIGMGNLLACYQQPDAAPPNTEETVLLLLLADSLQNTQWRKERAGALQLAATGAMALPRGKTRLHDAARHCLELIQGVQHAQDLTTVICWPGDLLAEPLHAWLGAYTMRAMPGATQSAHWPHLERLLDKRDTKHLWPADASQDRMTTAAMLVAVVGMSMPKQ